MSSRLLLATLFLTSVTSMMSLAPLARAGTALELAEEGDGAPRRMLLEVEGTMLRMDPDADSPGAGHSVLFDAEAETITLLDHGRRSWMSVDRQRLAELAGGVDQALAQARRQMEAQLQSMPPQQAEMVRRMMEQRMAALAPKTSAERPEATLRETGREEERAGRPARLVEVVEDGRVVRHHWVASWDAVGIGKAEAATLEAMMELTAEMARELPVAATGGSLTTVALDGMPVETVELEGGEATRTMTLVKASSRPVPAERFRVPDGYRERQLPSAPSVPAAGRPNR